MSLLKPTPGELVDRLIIVDLKFVYTLDAEQKEVLREEHLELYDRINEVKNKLIEDRQVEFNKVSGCLVQINSDLWEEEDKIRFFIKQGMESLIARSGKQIVVLNDQRRRLVAELDRLTGFDKVSDRKVYT